MRARILAPFPSRTAANRLRSAASVSALIRAAHLRGRDASPGAAAEAAQLLDQAITLWHGPPLADFRYGPFAQAEAREAYREFHST